MSSSVTVGSIQVLGVFSAIGLWRSVRTSKRREAERDCTPNDDAAGVGVTEEGTSDKNVLAGSAAVKSGSVEEVEHMKMAPPNADAGAETRVTYT